MNPTVIDPSLPDELAQSQVAPDVSAAAAPPAPPAPPEPQPAAPAAGGGLDASAPLTPSRTLDDLLATYGKTQQASEMAKLAYGVVENPAAPSPADPGVVVSIPDTPTDLGPPTTTKQRAETLVHAAYDPFVNANIEAERRMEEARNQDAAAQEAAASHVAQTRELIKQKSAETINPYDGATGGSTVGKIGVILAAVLAGFGGAGQQFAQSLNTVAQQYADDQKRVKSQQLQALTAQLGSEQDAENVLKARVYRTAGMLLDKRAQTGQLRAEQAAKMQSILPQLQQADAEAQAAALRERQRFAEEHYKQVTGALVGKTLAPGSTTIADVGTDGSLRTVHSAAQDASGVRALKEDARIWNQIGVDRADFDKRVGNVKGASGSTFYDSLESAQAFQRAHNELQNARDVKTGETWAEMLKRNSNAVFGTDFQPDLSVQQRGFIQQSIVSGLAKARGGVVTESDQKIAEKTAGSSVSEMRNFLQLQSTEQLNSLNDRVSNAYPGQADRVRAIQGLFGPLVTGAASEPNRRVLPSR